MNIKRISNTFNPFRRIEDKPDNSGSGNQNQNDQKKDEREFEKHFEVSSEAVDKAIDEFAKESHNKEKGINAMAIGNGPGLKVVLKDQGGKIVRQLSGEEFLKLRQNGRIFDRKA